jgi:hypothetical protein
MDLDAKKEKAPYGCEWIRGFWRGFNSGKGEVDSGKGEVDNSGTRKLDSEEADGKDNSGKGKVGSEDALRELSKQMESTPSAPPPILLTAASSAPTTKPPRVSKCKTSHLSAQPTDDVDVEAPSKLRSIQIDGVHTAADGEQDSEGAALGDQAEYQKAILTGMATTLKPAVESVGVFVLVAHIIAMIQTAVELVLNATVMMISAVPDDSFVYIGQQKDTVLAFLAASNGVLKGMDLKLQFEQRVAYLSEMSKALKTTQNKVKDAIEDLKASQAKLHSGKFNECIEDFQHLVSTYSTWLNDNDEQDKGWFHGALTCCKRKRKDEQDKA